MEISNKMKSDESKRSSIKFNEEYLGMSGTFRSLNVDQTKYKAFECNFELYTVYVFSGKLIF